MQYAANFIRVALLKHSDRVFTRIASMDNQRFIHFDRKGDLLLKTLLLQQFSFVGIK